MEILLASGHLPSPRATQGGSKTSYHLSRCFSSRHNVHLLTFATTSELDTYDAADMKVYHCWDILPVNNWKRLRGVLSAPGLPLAVAARCSREFRRRLRRMLQTHRLDVVILDHTALFQYFSEVSHIPVVVGCAHDVTTQKWQRRAETARDPISRSLLQLEYKRMRRWETDIFGRLHLILPHSPKDGVLARELQPEARVFVIQPWLSRSEAIAARSSAAEQLPNSIVFYGALNRQENIDAAEFIVAEVLPKIRQIVPDAKVYLAGSHANKLAEKYARCAGVVITGFLQDPIGFLSQMKVALLPLRLGAGIKTKVLECMSAGVPVVTTDVGAEGVGGSIGVHYCVGSSPEELAAEVVRLLCNDIEASRMGTAGRDYFFREFDFDRRIAELEIHLEELVHRNSASLAHFDADSMCLREYNPGTRR